MLSDLEIDRNVQAIKAVESVWGLPELPDPVKLDLASQVGQDPESVTEFLNGLESDRRASDRERREHQLDEPALTVAEGPSWTGVLNLPEGSPGERRRALTAHLIKGDRPKPSLDPDNAVSALKARAIQYGYLPEDTPLNEAWDPALRSIQYEMLEDQFDDLRRGKRPGGQTISNVAQFMDDWLSPTGLLSAAVDLQLLPDLGKTAEGWSNFWDNPSPGSFLSAVGETVEHAVLPVINTALLVNGVGQIMLIPRLANVARGASTFASFARRPGLKLLTKPLLTAGPLSAQAQPSFLSIKLGASRFGAAQLASKGMQGWRNLSGVQAAKVTVQQGMRLGLVARTEDALVPGTEGLISLSDNRSIVDWTQDVRHNPLAWGLGEWMFTPSKLFMPGAVGDLWSATKKSTRDILGEIPKNQVLSAHFHRGVSEYLAEYRPDLFQEFDQLVQADKGDSTRALAKVFTGNENDIEGLGEAMTFIAVSAAMDNEALKAKGVLAPLDATNTDEAVASIGMYHAIRNKLINQLRGYEGLTNAEIAERMADMRVADFGIDWDEAFEAAMAQIMANPEGARRAVGAWNETTRVASLNMLLDLSLEGAALEKYIPRVMDRVGTWSDFRMGLGMVDEMDLSGAMTIAQSARTQDEFVETLFSLAEFDNFGDEVVESVERGGMVSPLGKVTGKPRGSWTIALQDFWTREDRLGFIDRAERVLNARDALSRLRESGGLQLIIENLDETGRIEAPRLAELLSGDNLGDMEHLVGVLGEFEWTDNLASLVAKANRDLAFDPVWHEIMQVPPDLGLADKIERGRALARFAASGVDETTLGPEALEVYNRLKERGYKLVHGVDFFKPEDLIHVQPFETMIPRHQAQVSLGNFFARQDPDEYGWLTRQTREKAVADALIDGRSRGGTIADELVDRSSDGFQAINRDLHQIAEDMKAQGAEELARGARNGKWAAFRSRLSVISEGVPFTLADLSNPQARRRFIRELTEGVTDAGTELTRQYSADEALAIWHGLHRSRKIGFQHRGLAAMEDFFRSRPNLENVMGLLGQTRAGDSLWRSAAARGVAGAAAGAAAGTVLPGVDTEQGAIAGAVAGAGLGRRPAAYAAGKFYDDWSQYSYLSDRLVWYRDKLRFALSPIFDASRYTEGAVLATIGDKEVSVPLKQVTRRGWVKAKAKTVGKEEASRLWDEHFASFQNEWRRQHGWDLASLDDLSKDLREVGILGFNPSNWMTSAYINLRDAGVGGAEAWQRAVDIYTYGVRGRSAAEQSVNFVFFPFSFSKKAATHAAQFLSHDLTRAAALHDWFKTYEWMDEELKKHRGYSVAEILQDHLPVLEKLERLNVWAYGLNVGEFGGINAPFLKSGYESLAPLVPFMPTGVFVDNNERMDEISQIAQRMVPVWNDLTDIKNDLLEQSYVAMSSPLHITKRAEAKRGWDEWTTFKEEIDTLIKSAGFAGYHSLAGSENPQLVAIRSFVDQKRLELQQKYPAWKDSVAEATERRVDMNLDRNQLLLEIRNKVEAGERLSEHEVVTLEFDQLHELLWSQASERWGATQVDPEFLPVDLQVAVRRAAAEGAERSDLFRYRYNRWYQQLYGPIERELVVS